MRYPTLFGLTLLLMVSCQNEDFTNGSEISSSTEQLPQFLTPEVPDGIQNLNIGELSKKNASDAKREAVEENCVEKKVSFTQTDSDFFILDANSSLLWPGNLVAARSVQEGAPTSIPISGEDRNPVEVRVNVLSGTSASTSRTIKDPTPGKVQDNLNAILNAYYKSQANFPASFDISIQRIHDEKQFQLSLNAGYSGPSVNVAGSFGVDFSRQKTRYAVTLKQRFFTASVSPKEGVIGKNGWFNENVTPERLNPYVTDYLNVSEGQQNPSAYIESVTYGKLYTLIYESSSSALEVEAALNFAYKSIGTNVNADLKASYSSIFNESTVKVKQLGGSATSGIASSLAAMANNLDRVVDFLKEGAEVSINNPGYPISYKVNYTFDNRPFKVSSNLEYIKKDCDLVYYDNLRVDPTDVALYGTDHGTSGGELFGRIYVEKYDRELGTWYSAGRKLYWGYGIESHIGRDYYKFGQKRTVADGKVIDFKVRARAGERFRVVSIVGECDSECYVYRDGSMGSNEYEYNPNLKKWVDYTRHNPYVENYTVGDSFHNRTWNGVRTIVQGDTCYLDYDTYIIK
ncbi:thiol-activated cytolysin family protein [Tenacibaculum sp. 190524A02b]|uniref:thiol-activated cytolysin family protein n=1 Tax=Tenacibaculum vairaonense TaxID=3137860 RepID=UPI0031FAADE0